jgi:hypothetical protein
MTETKPKRRWFRFSLRTLLTVVAIAAVASWGYWVGWPWWQAYREQGGFEAAVRQLKAGVTTELADNQIPSQSHDTAILYSDSSGWVCAISKYFRRNANYCVYYVFPESSRGAGSEIPCVSVSVFRLPRAPHDYQALSEQQFGRRPPINDTRLQDMDYVGDFADFIKDDLPISHGIKFELIYSDPPKSDSASVQSGASEQHE